MVERSVHAAANGVRSDDAGPDVNVLDEKVLVVSVHEAGAATLDDVQNSSTSIEQSAHVGTNPIRHASVQLARQQLRVDARAALVGLGYRPAEAGKVVDLALERCRGTLEEVIREALRSCTRR